MKNYSVDTIVGCKIMIIEKKRKKIWKVTNSGDIILNVEYGEKILTKQKVITKMKNITACTSGEQLWVEHNKSTTSKINGQERIYDGDMNSNEYLWHCGRTNHGNNVYNNTSKYQKRLKEIRILII